VKTELMASTPVSDIWVGGIAVSAALPIPVIQLLQVLTVALGAPGVTGVIARVEARLQGRRGPRILQPYYDDSSGKELRHYL